MMQTWVDLEGKWIGWLNGKPVMIQMDGIIAVPCFDTKEKCLAVLARAGVPSDAQPATIKSEAGFLAKMRKSHPGVKMVYDVTYGLDGRYKYTLLDIDTPAMSDPKTLN